MLCIYMLCIILYLYIVLLCYVLNMLCIYIVGFVYRVATDRAVKIPAFYKSNSYLKPIQKYTNKDLKLC